jgi:tetratricopeptide (TPR) repeat protein
VLGALGVRESRIAPLEEAVTAYGNALQEFTRDRTPLDWATTHNNLGAALQTLGERESGTARLEEAAAAYHAAVRERARDRVPLQWAETQNNLGNAFKALGERESGESGIVRLQEAVAAFDAALSVFIADGAMHNVNLTRGNRDRAAALLTARRRDMRRAKFLTAAGP